VAQRAKLDRSLQRAPAPIFVLAAPPIEGALVGAMVGCNPAAFGAAELHLFSADSLEAAMLNMTKAGEPLFHGLYRTVAYLYAGEQSIEAVAMARRWVLRRMHWPTVRVFEELLQKAAPFQLVEKSRSNVESDQNLKRIAEACPDAFFLHVTNQPQAGEMSDAAGAKASERNGRMTRADRRSESAEHAREQRIAAFLANVPADRQASLAMTALLAEPERELTRVCSALGLPSDKPAIDAMMHPELSPFATMGPAGANLGDEPNFLANARFVRGAAAAGGASPVAAEVQAIRG
jgi:hypothetical protein